MGAYGEHAENAKKFIDRADHLLTETYPVVKDPRMLLAVLQNVYNAYKSMMLFYLYRDFEQGKIPSFDTDEDNMIRIFKARCERRYRISEEYVRILEETRNALKQHKSSPMEFSRQDIFVIADNDYNMQIISTQILRDYIGKAKLFIEENRTSNVKHERVFG